MPKDNYWGCAQTNPSQEGLALRNLRRQSFNALFPFFLGRTKWRHYTTRPLFPGYVLIELNPERNWSPINGTPGIHHLLTNTTKTDELIPARIPNSFINSLSRILVSNPDNVVIPLGTKVRILAGGAWNNKESYISESSHDRIKVLFLLLGKEVEVEFMSEQVEVLEEA